MSYIETKMSGNLRESKSAATIRRRRARTSSQTNGSSPLPTKHKEVDELLMEDPEVYIQHEFSGPPIIHLLLSNDWILFLGLLAFRSVNALLLQTSFVPDEYWQSVEVAHNMAFGYGYLTWEWKNGLRGYLYPLMFSFLYKVLDILHLDNRILLIKLPRLVQGMFSAAGDLYLYKTARKLSGPSVARWTLLCQLTSWFTFYTSVRVLTNSMETSLTTIALYYFPWPNSPRKAQWKYLSIVCLAVIIRPTASIVWLPLCTWHLWLYRHKILKLLVLFLLVGIGVMTVSLWVDRVFYGSWTNVPYNFLRFNVLSNLSTFYGTHPWHWYLTQGFPAILGFHIFPFALSLRKFDQPFLMAVIVWTISIYSLLGHKEFRFIFPVLPIAMYYCGLYLHSITKGVSQESNIDAQQPLTNYTSADNYTSSNEHKNCNDPFDDTQRHRFNNLGSNKNKLNRFSIQPKVVIILLVISNLPVALYTSLLHQRGTVDVMRFIYEETKYEVVNYNKMDVMFLMPCHSTPYYSYVHKNISMRFLTCEPPLNIAQNQNYIDEADVFYQNPVEWLKKEYQFNSNAESSKGKPTHLVMFNLLYPTILKFLDKHDYTECSRLFHSHVVEGRVGSHVHVMCSKMWLIRKEEVKKRRQFLHLSL